MPKKQELFQTVHITLSDGRKGVFTGPILVLPDDHHKFTIKAIRFTEPTPLPEDCSFGKLIEEDSESG